MAHDLAYVAGTVGGHEYVLGLKAVNCESGDMLAQEQLTAASKEKVLDALGLAAGRAWREERKKRAIIATARKLAVLLHRLWVSGGVYEPLRNSDQKAMPGSNIKATRPDV